MRRISLSLVVLAVVGALLAPGLSQSVAVPAGPACALVLTPLDTDAAGYYCSTALSNNPVFRWNIVGDTAWTLNVIAPWGGVQFSLSSYEGDPPSGKIDQRTGGPGGFLDCIPATPCRVRLHLNPLTGVVIGTVSLLPE